MARALRWVGLVVLTTMLLGASVAKAAFPGSNGLLAVQPRSGGGIVLIGANGAGARRICLHAPARCGTPDGPQWSPDGRALVFAGPGIRIVYPDGSCMDCAFGTALRPAFEAGGALVSFLQGGHMLVDGIDTIRKSAPSMAGLSEAVWSADGRLAVVRRGALWAGRPGHLTRLAVASEPSWSPNSRAIAAVERGWIVIIAVRGRLVRRLVRGSAPAFSPDGRWMAYVAPDHRLMVASTRPGPLLARPVGNVQAVSVDWQPRPRGRNPGCAVPPLSRFVARSRSAEVTADPASLPPVNFDPAPPVAYMGCLYADGRERLLERFIGNNVDNAYYVGKAALAAPYAALEVDYIDEHYGGENSTLRVFDLRTGRLMPRLGGESLDCGPCGGFDQIVVGSDGVSAVHTQSTLPMGAGASPIDSVSCAPAGTTCVAVDGAGYGPVLSTMNPTGGPGAWSTATLSGTLHLAPSTVACPSASLCVGAGPAIFAATNPTGGAAAWAKTATPAYENDIVCPSTTLCVATGMDGTIATSTDPSGGPGAWSRVNIDGKALESVFCSSQPQCFVSDSAGTVFTSSNPAGGAGAWSVSSTTPSFRAGSCPTTTLCVAVALGHIATTVEPSAGVWTQTASANPTGVACPSTSLCVVVGSGGLLAVSTNPAAGAWSTTSIDHGRDLTSVACPSSTLCVATDSTGHVVTSSDPAGGASGWTPTLLQGDPCADTTPCSMEQILASDHTGVHAVDSSKLSGSGPFLTGLTLQGDTLSWVHDGIPRSTGLKP